MMRTEKPTAILNPATVRRNIRRMADKASRSGVRLRPHFKTHQSAAVGEWFREAGVTGITVSSVGMAQYFADHGWDDITIAFPVSWWQIDTLNGLAGRVRLGLLVESPETIQFLQLRLTAPVNVWIKVDTGYNRTGVRYDDAPLIDQLAAALRLADKLTLAGLLTHTGQTYSIMGSRSIRSIYDKTVAALNQVQQQLQQRGFADVALSIGDTPTCSMLESFPGVNEIRPGNFVFYDMQQVSLGSCRVEDVAVAVACPVVAKHPWKNTLTIYGGSAHFSSDYDDGWIFGAVALPTDLGWSAPLPATRLLKLSQEHGIVQTTPDRLARTNVGDTLMILPIHACLTMNSLKGYTTLEGERLAMLRDF
ncbi:MAG: alanine racemase [Anaerolineae bacterium]|jgi:D-serine deaminase-like pyridoxal phosphate-dependent protein|nr:alanine racemase [Anaerolineae bacterium]